MGKEKKERKPPEKMTDKELEQALAVNLANLENLGQKIDRAKKPNANMLKTYHGLELKIAKIRGALLASRRAEEKDVVSALPNLAPAET